MSLRDSRCFGYHCPDNFRNNCVLHLKPNTVLPFQSPSVGESCNFYEPRLEFRPWGIGKDEELND